mmetsp:Transcript_96294/g.272216  ORF Transcript_96294/g.272216 Transcript_96294/m.272216 type:complete len:248 (+) Transcript_96294:94-837(+)
MPHVGVLFEIRRVDTGLGECVSVVGGLPELANWDPFDPKAHAALALHTNSSKYPAWSMASPVWISISAEDAWDNVASGDDDDCELPLHSPGDATAGATFQGAEAKVDEVVDVSPPCPANGLLERQESSSFRVEYKFVKDRRRMPDHGPSFQWEDAIANRRVLIPSEPGSIWIVSDSKFNDGKEPTVTRTSLAEILARREDADPEWTHDTDRFAPEWGLPEREETSTPGSCRTASSCSRHTTSTILML